MKNFSKIFFIFSIVFCSLKTGNAVDPTYSLNVINSVDIDANTIEFEIYLKHTNSGVSTFKYTTSQLVLKYDTSFANGGILTYTLAPGNPQDVSDLPESFRLRNPVVRGNELLLACNIVQSESSSPVISSAGNGTKLMKMRLHTTASSFSGSPDLRWKNVLNKGQSTQVGAYVNGVFKKITDSTSHFIGISTTGNINISMILEGFYNPGLNKMNMSDSVTAQLRNSSSPYAVVDVSEAIVDELTSTGNFIFASAPTGIYYIVIRHRNSIETWSKAGGESYTSGSNMNYDFTTAVTQSFGSNMIQVDNSPVKFGIFGGDVNQDGVIDGSDASTVDNDAANFETGYLVTDVNGDSVVDGADGLIVNNNGTNFVGKINP